MDQPFQENYFEGEPPYLLTNNDDFDTGTTLRTFSIIDTKSVPEGYEVKLTLDLGSGYELENATLKLSHDDLTAYETTDVQTAVKFALGFFEEEK